MQTTRLPDSYMPRFTARTYWWHREMSCVFFMNHTNINSCPLERTLNKSASCKNHSHLAPWPKAQPSFYSWTDAWKSVCSVGWQGFRFPSSCKGSTVGAVTAWGILQSTFPQAKLGTLPKRWGWEQGEGWAKGQIRKKQKRECVETGQNQPVHNNFCPKIIKNLIWVRRFSCILNGGNHT